MSSYADAAGIPIANADSSNCTGSNIVYGPSGCSGCCSGYDGAGREAIQYIQNLLVTLGYLEVASVTGQYGEKTYAAVQAFQKALWPKFRWSRWFFHPASAQRPG